MLAVDNVCSYNIINYPPPPTKTTRPPPTPAVDVGDGEFNNVGSQIGQQIGNAKRSTSEVIAPEDVIDDSEIANRQRRSLVGVRSLFPVLNFH